MPRSINHCHTYALYKRRSGKLAKDKVFKCLDPHCYHFLEYERVLGKASHCNACGAEFILDYKALQSVYPRCLNCSNSKEARAHKAAAAIVRGLLPAEDEELSGDEIGD